MNNNDGGRGPSLDFLLDRFELNHKEGKLYYRTSVNSRGQKGRPAGTVNALGYTQIRIHGRSYLAHRLIFYMTFGRWPGMLDHVNGNRSDNRASNIRECSPTENLYNSRRPTSNTSGYKGIRLEKGKYAIRMYVNGRPKRFGRTETLQEAVDKLNKIRKEHHGEFARNA